MKAKETKSKRMVMVSEDALLSLVASELKGKDLFPKKTARAKETLKHTKFPDSW
jgi:hypothetical protein